MSIGAAMTKVESKRLVGIDASTQSFAFAIFEGEKPISCGQVFFKGASVFERLADARKKIRFLVEHGVFDGVDFIVIESAVMVRSQKTVIDLAYVFGCILSEMSEVTTNLEKVTPIQWQTAIGNPNLKKAEKDKIKEENPGRSESWLKNKGREVRKKRTLDIARRYFNIDSGSDDVGDAIGIAIFASHNLNRR